MEPSLQLRFLLVCGAAMVSGCLPAANYRPAHREQSKVETSSRTVVDVHFDGGSCGFVAAASDAGCIIAGGITKMLTLDGVTMPMSTVDFVLRVQCPAAMTACEERVLIDCGCRCTPVDGAGVYQRE